MEGNIKKIASKMEMSPDITRSGLAVYVCEELSFRDRKGDLQIGSCLKALGELESLGLVSLPAARTGIGKNWSFRRMEGYDLSPVGLPERVDQIRDLSLTLVSSKDEKRMRIHNELILKDHPQGIKRVVGRQVRYLVESEHGYLGAVTFGSSALRLFARDQWIGWNKDQQVQHQNDVINMNRFLIVKSVSCKNLASRVLSMVVKQIEGDFETLYGYRPLLIESFVDTDHYQGTCYQAANFERIGKTKGRGRNDRYNKSLESVKDIYMYVLDNDFRKKMGIAFKQEEVEPLPANQCLNEKTWAEQELGEAALGDARLTRRLIKIAGQKGALQGVPYAQAAKGDLNDIKGYYYFIDLKKEEVSFETILAPHQTCVIRRMASFKTVLVVQDTTDLNYTPNKECQGLGPIGTNKNKIEAKGLSLHTCFAFSEEGLPLGILNATCRTPEWPEEKIRKSERRKLPIERKKTYKWLQSYLDCVAVSQKIPDTRMIAVMDREADIFELYEQVMGTGNKVPVIIRAQHDRRLSDTTDKLWDDVAFKGQRFEVDVEIPAQRKRIDKKSREPIAHLPARTARLCVRYKKVHLNLPSDTRTLYQKPMPLYAVYATEENPPDAAVKIDWMLLTSLKITTTEEAMKCILYYKKRWGIETWHRVMKTGSGIERYRFREAERLKRALAIDMIVSWRVMFLTLSGRNTPEANATDFLDKDECDVLEKAFFKKTLN